MPQKNHFAEKIAALGKTQPSPQPVKPKKTEAKSAPPARRGKDKAANFVRLAEKRHFAVIEGLRLVGNLSDTNNYESTEDQVAMILDSIQEELNATRARFKVAARKQKRGPLKLVA